MTPREIQHAVSRHFNVEFDFMRTANSPRAVNPRAVAMYLVRTLLHLSLKETARYFERDHTSVVHAVRKVEKKPELMEAAREVGGILEGRVTDFCQHCGQRLDKKQAMDELRAEQKKLAQRIEIVGGIR